MVESQQVQTGTPLRQTDLYSRVMVGWQLQAGQCEAELGGGSRGQSLKYKGKQLDWGSSLQTLSHILRPQGTDPRGNKMQLLQTKRLLKTTKLKKILK